jgi:hypothetical protein
LKNSHIRYGSGFQPRGLISRLEAAPTVGLFNRDLSFPDMRIKELSLATTFFSAAGGFSHGV